MNDSLRPGQLDRLVHRLASLNNHVNTGKTKEQAISAEMRRDKKQHCPECGCPWYGNKNLLGDGSRECFNCGQDWWTNIVYTDSAERKELPDGNISSLGRCAFGHFTKRKSGDTCKICAEHDEFMEIIESLTFSVSPAVREKLSRLESIFLNFHEYYDNIGA